MCFRQLHQHSQGFSVLYPVSGVGSSVVRHNKEFMLPVRPLHLVVAPVEPALFPCLCLNASGFQVPEFDAFTFLMSRVELPPTTDYNIDDEFLCVHAFCCSDVLCGLISSAFILLLIRCCRSGLSWRKLCHHFHGYKAWRTTT